MKHLLIDFENIQPQNLDKLPTEDTHIWLFLGTQHKSLPISLVASLLPFGERAHLIHLQKSGKNALDFYLSYYLGKITSTDPDAQIGILSRDGGYDILVDHILEKQEAKGVVRLANIDEVQHTKINTKPPTKLLEQKIEQYILNIKPKTFTDFQAAVKKRAGALSLSVNEVDIQALARHLREQNHIRLNKGKIEYAPFSSL